MSKYSIRIYGDPVLRRQAEDITEFDDSLKQFAGEMIEAMIEGDGIGLAAPQVGVSKRFLVIGIPVESEERENGEEAEEKREIVVMANPEYVEMSEEEVVFEEGCLSIPGITEDVSRPEKLKIRYQDVDGEYHEMVTGGVLARVIQHEVDHLDGVLFIDHLSPIKRSLLRGKLKRLQAEHANSVNGA